MIRLSLFRSQSKGLVDYLQPAALVDEFTVVCKNGALMTAFAYAGTDAESATHDELNRTAGVANRVLARLGSGWCTYHDAVRRRTDRYLAQRHPFPDPVSQAIEDERRAWFEGQGAPFETYYVLTLVWLPPTERAGKVGELMLSTGSLDARQTAADQHLQQFEATVENIHAQLATLLDTRRLGQLHSVDESGRAIVQHELLAYLSSCVSGVEHPVTLPSRPMYLDSLIGAHDFHGGITPMVGDQYIQVVAIDGFPVESYPTILAGLDGVPVTYRWSNRFIHLDPSEAVAEIGKYRLKWQQKIRGFADQLANSQKGPVNRDAAAMTDDAEQAMAEASGALVSYGYYTSVVVLFDIDLDRVEHWAKEVRRLLNNRGFSARIETINAVEAYLGAIPGHPDVNIRRPLISTDNLADLIPLAAIWAGSADNECPLYPPDSPALMQVSATGSTPFRLNLHVDDIGHTLILGPTGSGKSTLLAVLQAQMLRYPNAQVFCFDKGLSSWAIVHGVGGQHYDIGSDTQRWHFQPLALIDSDSYLTWAAEWIESLVILQGEGVGPERRRAIHSALLQLRHSDTRSLTEFSASVQDTAIREAIHPYTIAGSLGELLDAEHDQLADSHFSVFEIETLMAQGDKYLLPVLTYLFKRIEMRLDGRASFLLVDEAWVVLRHPVFREKIREWLKVLRKANCAVLMATQSLSDLASSGIADVIAESCPTRILLPNPAAGDELSKPLYREVLGLNDAQIEIIAMATPKRHYYYSSPRGNRLFELALGPEALRWCAVSGRAAKERIEREAGGVLCRDVV